MASTVITVVRGPNHDLDNSKIELIVTCRNLMGSYYQMVINNDTYGNIETKYSITALTRRLNEAVGEEIPYGRLGNGAIIVLVDRCCKLTMYAVGRLSGKLSVESNSDTLHNIKYSTDDKLYSRVVDLGKLDQGEIDLTDSQYLHVLKHQPFGYFANQIASLPGYVYLGIPTTSVRITHLLKEVVTNETKDEPKTVDKLVATETSTSDLTTESATDNNYLLVQYDTKPLIARNNLIATETSTGDLTIESTMDGIKYKVFIEDSNYLSVQHRSAVFTKKLLFKFIEANLGDFTVSYNDCEMKLHYELLGDNYIEIILKAEVKPVDKNKEIKNKIKLTRDKIDQKTKEVDQKTKELNKASEELGQLLGELNQLVDQY